MPTPHMRFTPGGSVYQRLAYEPTANVTATPPPIRYEMQKKDGKNKSSVPKPAPTPDPGEEEAYTPRPADAPPVAYDPRLSSMASLHTASVQRQWPGRKSAQWRKNKGAAPNTAAPAPAPAAESVPAFRLVRLEASPSGLFDGEVIPLPASAKGMVAIGRDAKEEMRGRVAVTPAKIRWTGVSREQAEIHRLPKSRGGAFVLHAISANCYAFVNDRHRIASHSTSHA